MHNYDDCLKVVQQFSEFKKVYGCYEDEENFYFLIRIAFDNPFYQVNKKTLSVKIIPGVTLQKRQNELKRVK